MLGVGHDKQSILGRTVCIGAWGALKSAGWGLGSTSGRRELGPGSVGAADIGLAIWKDSWDVQA